ncbi:MAG TPA: hypothetical protein DDW98_15390 [Gammaproteobacteria bacterium]|nr:hypothetical protein [Gammaproteobacteria bacterium]
MNRVRTLLSVLLGLVLLVQGFAVSAAPRAKLSEGAPAFVSVVADMPCHAQKAAKTDHAGEQARSCCNASCPDMTTCALGHLASVATISVALPQLTRAENRFTPVLAVSRVPNSLLRPPIALHG